jgi:hypothetical protein
MPRNSDEKEFRLRPRKPLRQIRREPRAWAAAFKAVIHYARASQLRKVKSGLSAENVGATRRPRNQRCAIRVTYSKNTVRGQWRAHGRYVARESAAGDPHQAGFDRHDQGIDIDSRLGTWQSAGDQRLWKMIISPEFGDRVDLTRLAREMMDRVERDLKVGLEWVAVAHFNTEHPHVHVALRGVGADSEPLHLRREYVKNGIRSIAEDLCTRQLGHRTDLDATESERREIREKRFTSLDRLLVRQATVNSGDSRGPLKVSTGPLLAGGSAREQTQQRHLAARLSVLGEMGLAEQISTGTWNLRQDFQTVLQAMQRTADRQKTIAAHGALLSDARLPIEVTNWHTTTSIAGRVLMHGEDEASGQTFLMLEGIDARVHFVYHNREITRVRAAGGLKVNSYAQLSQSFIDGKSRMIVEDSGDSEGVLRDKGRLRATAAALLKKGILPTEDCWGGWLGRYQAALHEAARELQYPARTRDPEKPRDRHFGR